MIYVELEKKDLVAFTRTEVRNLPGMFFGGSSPLLKPFMKELEDLLPAEKSPTISNLVDSDFGAIEVIVDDTIERLLVPKLKRAGASAIITYPLNKVIH